MKKLLRLICLAAIVCVAYLALTTPRGEAEPALKIIDAEADENAAQLSANDIAGQAKAAGQDAVKKADEAIEDVVARADEAIGDVVKQADEVLDNAVEQADKAISDAVESAAAGAKQGFIESLKESASEFWEKLFP